MEKFERKLTEFEMATNGPKFHAGETVIYKNGSTFELGVIKSVVETPEGYSYRVWYHTGDTTALTYEDSLRKINNNYAFTVIRHSCEDEIDKSPARQMAADILSNFNFYGDCYYQLEDWLTKRLEGRKTNFPSGIQKEFLSCVLRDKIKNLFELHKNAGAIDDYDSDDIEECVKKIIVHHSADVLNTHLMDDIVTEWICSGYGI